MSSSVVRSCSSFAVFFAFFRFLGFAMITSVEPNQTYVRKYENLYKTKPVSLIDLVQRFGSEEICRDYLLAIRWPEGAICLMVESKKSMSANQVKRTLGTTYKTAWYLCHRIREAMETLDSGPALFGVIELDETMLMPHPRHRLPGRAGMGLPK